MSQVVVVSKHKLLEKTSKGFFNPKGQKKTIRERMVILKKTYSDSQHSCASSGILYVLNEKENKKFHSKPKKVAAKKEEQTTKEQ